MDKGFLLYGHGGSFNRGCEALVRSTASIIKQKYDFSRIVVCSEYPHEDIQVNISEIDQIIPSIGAFKKWHPLRFRWAVLRRTPGLFDYASKITFNKLMNIDNNDWVALSIGGDNYCYDPPYWLYGINKYIRSKGIQTILWGCSMEREKLNELTTNDFLEYEKIICRESLTYELMLDIGAKKVFIAPDPAFVLEPNDNIDIPEMFSSNTVGINLSPLILGYERNAGIVLKSIIKVINYILTMSDKNIILVPHVTRNEPLWSDHVVLEQLKQNFPDHLSRIWVAPIKYNAAQMKAVISKCDLFIGARTHSIIAAYSSYVPAIALGYSVKAIGIANDLFGDLDGMVVDVRNTDTDDELLKAYMSLVERSKELRELLKNKIPEWQERAKRMVDLL